MKTKTLYFTGLLLVTAILLTTFASAAATIADLSVTQPEDLTKSNTETTFKITNTHDTDPINLTISVGNIEITDENGDIAYIIPLDVDLTSVNVSAGNFTEVIISIVGDLPADLFDEDGYLLGEYSADVEITDSSATSDSTTKTVTFANTYCSDGYVGELEINDVEDQTGNDNDWEWFPQDEVTIDLEVKNRHTEDIDDIVVKWCLYDNDQKECVIEDEENDFDLDAKGDDDDERDVSLSFTLDLDDLDLDSDDYVFYIKAYSDDELEENQCADFSEDITLLIDDDEVIVNNVQIPETAACDSQFEVSATLYNIGEDEQEDFTVNLISDELGIDEEILIDSLKSGKQEDVSFLVSVPKDAEEGKTYTISFVIYDEDGEVYELGEDDEDEAIFNYPLKILGNCIVPEAVEITAVYDPADQEIVAGKQVSIKATVKNIGISEYTYNVLLLDYSDWASLDNIEPQSFTLAEGESKDVYIYLTPNEDVSGDKSFTIKAMYNNQFKTVPVVIEDITESGIGGTDLFKGLGDNWYIWAIVALNIILVVAIIIVAVRIVRRG